MLQDVKAPDLGTDSADVIEIAVRVGDRLRKEQTIAVLESAKASMEVPSPVEGVVREVLISIGAKVTEGALLLRVETEGQGARPVFLPADEPVEPVSGGAVEPTAPVVESTALALPPVAVTQAVTPPAVSPEEPLQHCGPAVRRLARELGVRLAEVTGSGPKGRILKEDVHAWVKLAMTRPPQASPVESSGGLPPLPVIDFSKWGPVAVQPLSRIQALSARNLHRAWVNIPHVTQFDEADITELEAFRVARKDAMKAQGVNLTLLAFLVKAVAHLLKRFPRFNASLAPDGENLILKEYVHIGVAVDTPNGLVVPVIRDCDHKSVGDIGRELGELSAKARDKKLSPAEMQGACFSISSLGGIGGTAFTPIVNWPEVAILGVSRSARKPVWDGHAFQPRLMLPLSLSYDHRVIDGADAARFTTALADVLSDIRQILL